MISRCCNFDVIVISDYYICDKCYRCTSPKDMEINNDTRINAEIETNVDNR